MLLLQSSDVQKVIAGQGLDAFMDRMIAELEIGFRRHDPYKTSIPARAGFVRDGLIEWMPVCFGDQSVVIKTVSYLPDNPERNGLPTVQAHISRSNWRDGTLSEIVEGGLLTAVRTGAASAVASRILAHPHSRVLGLVGCGAQSITQAHAISRCFDIERILTFDICDASHASIVERLAFLGIPVIPSDLEDLERQSDILCTTTSVEIGADPVVSGIVVKPHLHINAVGADFPGKLEMPPGLLVDTLVIPDHREQAMREGECQRIRLDRVGPELHEVVRNAENYSAHRHRRTLFDSTGTALEDALALDLTCRLARAAGIGQDIDFGETGRDPKNPYGSCLTVKRRLPSLLEIPG